MAGPSESTPLLAPPQDAGGLSSGVKRAAQQALLRARSTLHYGPLEGSRSSPCLEVLEKAAAGRQAETKAMRSRLQRLAEFSRQRRELKERRGGKGHSFWYSVLSAHSHRREAAAYRIFISVLILGTILAFVLESDAGFKNRNWQLLQAFEGFSSCIFLAEYCLRLSVVPEQKRYASLQPWGARAAWACSFESIVDLVALLPWFLERGAALTCTLTAHGCGVQLPNLQFLRVLRLFRLLKSAPVIHSFDVVARVLYYNAEILCVALIICLVLLLLTSTLLYYLQPADSGHAGEDYSSIVATMYLSVMMLTGQGGPDGQLPWYTKAVVTTTAVFSVAQFAIPAAMLTWGFEQEAERRMRKQHEVRKKQVERIKRGQPAAALSSSSSGESTDSEWEEYEGVVCGSSSSSSSSSESADVEKPTPKKKVERNESLHRKSTTSRTLASVSMCLSRREQARLERIFAILDRSGSGSVDIHELSAISDPKGAEGLWRRFGLEDGKAVSSEKFFAWLAEVKKSSKEGIFEMLLDDLEGIHSSADPAGGAPCGPELSAHRAARASVLAAAPTRALSPATPPPPAAPASAAIGADGIEARSMPDVLQAFAQQFRELQEENARLREELLQKDETISELRRKCGGEA